MTSRGRQWTKDSSEQFSRAEGQLHICICIWSYIVMIHCRKWFDIRGWKEQLSLLFLHSQTSLTWNKRVFVFLSFINVLRGMALTKHECHAWNLQRSDSWKNWRLWICRWTSWGRCHTSCMAVPLCRPWLQTTTCWDTSPVSCAASAASTSYPWLPTTSTSYPLVSP